MILVAGSNGEFGATNNKWTGWLADASTAFLQGQQRQEERSQPLCMRPPSDGLIAQTPHWKATVVPHQVEHLRSGKRATPVVHRGDYQALEAWLHPAPVRQAGLLKEEQPEQHHCGLRGRLFGRFSASTMTSARSTQSLHLGKPELLRAFKGKELTLRLNSRGKHVLYISQTEFIRGLDSGKVPKDADLEQPLTAEQQGELRSVAGCLQAVVVRAIAPRAFPQVALNSRSSLKQPQVLVLRPRLRQEHR